MSSYPTLEIDVPVPAGALLAEWLEENGWTQRQLAEAIGKSTKTTNQIINGSAPLTPDTALDLEAATGIKAKLWSALEANYRTDLAALRRVKPTEEQVAWLAELPITELRKRGRIHSATSEKAAMLRECLAFFDVESVDEWRERWINPQAALRQSTKLEIDKAAVAAWLRLGGIEAEQVDVTPFSEDALRAQLGPLRGLTREPDGSRLIAELLRLTAEAGVALVFVPEIVGSRAYGATYWISPRKAVIEMSLRGKADDHFWFTLFHEIAHLLLHSRPATFIEGPDREHTGAESEADEFAADHLIPPADVERLRGLRSKQSVVAFADQLGLATGVVVGRWQRETGLFTHLNALKRKVNFVE